MNDGSKIETLQPGGGQGGGARESGAAYGNAQGGGGMDSSGGTGSDGTGGGVKGGGGESAHEQADQAVQRSETPQADDIEFEADDDLIDNDQ